MEEARLVELLPSVGLAIALAACAGVRAWLPLLLAGGLARSGFLELGDSFSFLSSDKALLLFGLATVLEIVADKVPALDHALDALSTVLRPAAGTLLAASVIGRFADPLTALALGVAVGVPAALVPHAAKSTLRAVSSTLTAGLANPVISVIEDALAVVMFVLAVLVPIAVVLVLLGVAFLVARRVSRRPSPAPAA
ncbi:MAG TPA: DUF4126 domain-containing protein [Vicinamibacteria bacterium]|nr:DUF4126 domain-containing protein [Vicinamibacteria bacterium]